MSRWVDVVVPWDRQGPAVMALVAAFGELPGLTMDMSTKGDGQTISLMDVGTAEQITLVLEARGITVLSARTRIAEALEMPGPAVDTFTGGSGLENSSAGGSWKKRPKP